MAITWAYVEQANVYVQFDMNVDYDAEPNTYQNSLMGIYATTLPLYYCPSDRINALWMGDAYCALAATTASTGEIRKIRITPPIHCKTRIWALRHLDIPTTRHAVGREPSA